MKKGEDAKKKKDATHFIFSLNNFEKNAGIESGKMSEVENMMTGSRDRIVFVTANQLPTIVLYKNKTNKLRKNNLGTLITLIEIFSKLPKFASSITFPGLQVRISIRLNFFFHRLIDSKNMRLPPLIPTLDFSVI
ncbi:MAG TPA: hypothetical protein EYN05_01890 [Nitrospinaceae bacterium]|nr:hypothetical protein [Nitrospinaceae bacterium]